MVDDTSLPCFCNDCLCQASGSSPPQPSSSPHSLGRLTSSANAQFQVAYSALSTDTAKLTSSSLGGARRGREHRSGGRALAPHSSFPSDDGDDGNPDAQFSQLTASIDQAVRACGFTRHGATWHRADDDSPTRVDHPAPSHSPTVHQQASSSVFGDLGPDGKPKPVVVPLLTVTDRVESAIAKYRDVSVWVVVCALAAAVVVVLLLLLLRVACCCFAACCLLLVVACSCCYFRRCLERFVVAVAAVTADRAVTCRASHGLATG